VEVDFSVTANNSPVSRGGYVENEWAEFGLTLSAAGGYGTRPRVFDTANPGKKTLVVISTSVARTNGAIQPAPVSVKVANPTKRARTALLLAMY
jgi:hypothetical protein